jgi:hypothetical protein
MKGSALILTSNIAWNGRLILWWSSLIFKWAFLEVSHNFVPLNQVLAVHKFIQFVYDKHYASTCQFDLLSFSYFFGRNSTLWKSKWNVQLQFEYSLSHCNKKWTYGHQFTALLGIVYLFILDSVSLPPTFSIEFVLVILLVMILNLETELRNLSLYNVLKYCFWTTLHLFELIWEQKGSKC